MNTFSPARKAHIVVFAAIALALSGCTAADSSVDAPSPDRATDSAATPLVEFGDPGAWKLIDPSEVTDESTTLVIAVTRVDCASGVTGRILEPLIEFESDRIVIRADVEELDPGVQTCQGNDAVPMTIDLTEPVGDRELVDAYCLDATAVTTAPCAEGGVRWQP